MSWNDFVFFVGAFIISLGAIVSLGAALFVLWAFFQRYVPQLFWKRPQSLLVLHTYAREERDGEGRRIKINHDLRVKRWFALSRRRWIFGVLLFEEDDGK